jgi:hypothetical protein
MSTSAAERLRNLQEFSASDRPGQRAFTVPQAVAEHMAAGGALADLATRLMGKAMRAVRVLYFDKTPGANWAVPWHQDRTIAVDRRVEVPGFGAWTLKGGIHHVEPPEAILANMISVRLQLDDCGPRNGPLLALRGSFGLGRVASSEIASTVQRGSIQICCAKPGDAVAMRGLTIHASERALRPEHRRVLHVDFSADDLPNGLRWAMA